MLFNKNRDELMDYLRQRTNDLLAGKVDTGSLILSKKYAKTEYKTKQAHHEVVKRMQAQSPDDAPKVGDRVPFLFVTRRDSTPFSKKTPMSERAEHPIRVSNHNLPIDYEYYYHHQFRKPVARFCMQVLGRVNVESILGYCGDVNGDDTDDETVPIKRKAPGKKLHSTVKLSAANSPLAGFVKIYKKKEVKTTEEVNAIIDVCKVNYSTCRDCQKDNFKKVKCQTFECPLFYKREKDLLDLKNLDLDPKIISQFEF